MSKRRTYPVTRTRIMDVCDVLWTHLGSEFSPVKMIQILRALTGMTLKECVFWRRVGIGLAEYERKLRTERERTTTKTNKPIAALAKECAAFYETPQAQAEHTKRTIRHMPFGTPFIRVEEKDGHDSQEVR